MPGGIERDFASRENAVTSGLELDEVRTQLVVAESDASRALKEASRVARILINDELRGPFTAAGLATMRERLEVLRHALHDLERVQAELRRRAGVATGQAMPVAPPPAAPDVAPVTPGACRRCHRDDAIVPLRICMRCTAVAGGEEARWASSAPGLDAVMAGSMKTRVPRRGPA